MRKECNSHYLQLVKLMQDREELPCSREEVVEVSRVEAHLQEWFECL